MGSKKGGGDRSRKVSYFSPSLSLAETGERKEKFLGFARPLATCCCLSHSPHNSSPSPPFSCWKINFVRQNNCFPLPARARGMNGAKFLFRSHKVQKKVARGDTSHGRAFFITSVSPPFLFKGPLPPTASSPAPPTGAEGATTMNPPPPTESTTTVKKDVGGGGGGGQARRQGEEVEDFQERHSPTIDSKK